MRKFKRAFLFSIICFLGSNRVYAHTDKLIQAVCTKIGFDRSAVIHNPRSFVYVVDRPGNVCNGLGLTDCTCTNFGSQTILQCLREQEHFGQRIDCRGVRYEESKVQSSGNGFS